jgi:hypothetical protein
LALTGDRIGVPEAEEAPVVVMPRWKQPIAGIIGLIVTFVITLIAWYIVALGGAAAFLSLIGGFGLMGVLFAIWFENWPFSTKFDKPWKVGIAATILNVIVIVIMVFVTIWFSGVYGAMLGITDPLTAYWVGASIFGALSASCFSFAVLWVAGTMYWPWFDKRQPGRGIRVFIVGWIITLVAWAILFFPYGNPAATALNPLTWVLPMYGINMAWTQWIIFFSLLTLMTFEYWPWDKLGSQPKIGIAAFVVCSVLGFIWVYVAGIVGFIVTDPLFQLLGFVAPADVSAAVGLWNVAYADWLIVAVIAVALFLDNWPKGYSQKVNLLIRLVTVVILGTLFFILSYYFSPILGMAFVGSPYYDNLTAFLVFLLWIELVFAYLWRKWPVYTTLE